MQDILYRDKPYIQLVVLDTITANSPGWEGFLPDRWTRTRSGTSENRTRLGEATG